MSASPDRDLQASQRRLSNAVAGLDKAERPARRISVRRRRDEPEEVSSGGPDMKFVALGLVGLALALVLLLVT